MKMQFKNSPTITSEDIPSSVMGVAKGSEYMILSYLRDKIYTDKVLACIRETVTNSQDEHIKYNIDKPVDVKIENVNDQYIWSSRDYAKGLSEEAIRTIYGMYGGSDKRNNNTQVGGFGIGALSPFAISDSFYITSYHEGFKTQYACILGAGGNGVSVGEIYKVSDPEPTIESGLEVSLDVSKNYYDFHEKTTKFVSNFLPDATIVYTDNRGDKVTPLKPILTKDIDGFIINLYPSEFDSEFYKDCVAIRMGGVVYKMRSDISAMNAKGKIVVDVPIGELTIPISREDLEDTPSNRKVLDRIAKAIQNIVEDDKSKIVTPKFGDACIANNLNGTYEGEWFTYSFSTTFPDSHYLKKKLEYLHTGYNHNLTNNKYVVYMIPDIKSYRSWVKRLDYFINLTFPNTQIIWMTKPSSDIASTNTLDISDVNFVDVKKLGLPKLPKQAGQTEYLVYFDGYKKDSYTAEDLDEYVTETYFKDEGISDGWEKKINDSYLLKRRVIGLTGDFGTSNPFWICNSKKMKEQLLELGWFEPSSKEYTERLSEIRAIEKAKQDMENAEYRVKNVLFKIKPSVRTVNVIGKNPLKIARLEKVKSMILKEDSFRGRILSSIESYYPKMTREDLRKILNTK